MKWRGDEETEFDPTGPASATDLPADIQYQGFSLTVLEGADAGTTWNSSSVKCSIGSHPSNDLTLKDKTVSRFHCEVRLDEDGPRVQDLKSRNGTVVDGVRVVDAFLKDGSMLRLGQTVVTFRPSAQSFSVRLSQSTSFGSMVGSSTSMRALFATLELAAASDATVLLEGETGTGKEVAARSIHETSGRSNGPFVVVDCSAIPGNLLESELFGHERGAFTGADARRDGAFTAACGGTVFLDEVGELPLELQPKVLRVLEQRAVRRLGGTAYEEVDVRFIAATNRTLRTEVNEGRFRPDLYYRLAVITVALPALRQRPEDIPQLAEHILGSLGADALTVASLLSPELLAHLRNAAWPGNVRELRNYLERCVVLQEALPIQPVGGQHSTEMNGAPIAGDVDMPYSDARQRTLDLFEKRYVEALLEKHDGNVTRAAEAAGLSRVYLYRLLRRHGLRK